MKTCPFCGGKADIVVDSVFWVYCVDCQVSTDDCNTEGEAIKLWNERKDVRPKIDCPRCRRAFANPYRSEDWWTTFFCSDCILAMEVKT